MQSPETKPAHQDPQDQTQLKPGERDKENPPLRDMEEASRRNPPSEGLAIRSSNPERTPGRTPSDSTSLTKHRAATVEPFVEAGAAAEFLHYSPRSIKQMAREGRIPAHPFGSGPRKRWYFLISELAEHLYAQLNSAHGEAGRDKRQRRVI
jgi:hypothetical protein